MFTSGSGAVARLQNSLVNVDLDAAVDSLDSGTCSAGRSDEWGRGRVDGDQPRSITALRRFNSGEIEVDQPSQRISARVPNGSRNKVRAVEQVFPKGQMACKEKGEEESTKNSSPEIGKQTYLSRPAEVATDSGTMSAVLRVDLDAGRGGSGS